MRYSELLLSLTCSFLVVACSKQAPSPTSTSLPLPPDDVSPVLDAMVDSGAEPRLQQTRSLQPSVLSTQASPLTMSQAELDKLYLEARQQIREAAVPVERY